MKVLHNPRCGKSRACLNFLDENKKDYEVVEYLKNPLTIEELQKILELLDVKPIEIVRQKEKIWIDNYKGKELAEIEVLKAINEHPILLERPIVIDGNKAYITRDNETLKLLI